MATIKDIAREAGVSYMTVSNVIHGRTNKVSGETIEKINKIIKRLNYVPNMSARSLVSNSSHVVAFINYVNQSSTGKFVSDPFNSIIIDSLEKELGKSNYYLMLKTIQSVDDLMVFLQNWNIDGLFFVGTNDKDIVKKLKETNISTIFIDSYIDEKDIINIGIDDYQGAYCATEYLVKSGHTNIALAVPHLNALDAERLRGYKAALEAHNIKFDKSLVYENKNYGFDGSLIGKELSQNQKITAVFATADILAAEIINGLYTFKINVPNQISVVGFDDINICKLITPNLTTIHQNMFEKGRIAAEYMIKSLNHIKISNPKIVLPIHLIERDSVKVL